MATKKGTAKSTIKSTSETRPEDYIPQQGNKATLTLADFTDDNLFAELRRRGYNGTLRYSKVINV
ncbi:MAG: hypothetical protein HDS02_03670 [Bacteroides sp.]|nr:hypothetical protein [Bacteroides sp.]